MTNKEKKPTYTYKDIKLPLDQELNIGLAHMAFYFFTAYGFPVEMFNDIINKDGMNKAKQLLFYMNFRNIHPEVFNNK